MNTKRNYLLLTPGPLSTSETVREAMLQDWCTWDKDYNEGIVTPIRKGLLAIAGLDEDEYTDVLLQGSGTYCVEANHRCSREADRQTSDPGERCLRQTYGTDCGILSY